MLQEKAVEGILSLILRIMTQSLKAACHDAQPRLSTWLKPQLNF